MVKNIVKPQKYLGSRAAELRMENQQKQSKLKEGPGAKYMKSFNKSFEKSTNIEFNGFTI
jgi:hypothetical protein